MTQGSRVHKNILIAIAILFILLLLIDRYYWAQISQWREDQATNIWLGFTSGIGSLPVGLISSRKIPNPNGMPLLGVFLSILPNLLSVSFLLGTLQIIGITLVGWQAFGQRWRYFLLATMPALSSVILRSTSVEFWNQYTITLLNIFFIFWAIRYLENRSLWNLPPIAVLILVAPALYLAGIVNAAVMALITVGMMLYKRPVRGGFWFVSTIILLLVLSSMLLTWWPYFRNISFDRIIQYSQVKPDPVGTVPWAFKQADPRILSGLSQTLLKMTEWIYILEIVFGLTAFLSRSWYGVSSEPSANNPDQLTDSSSRQTVILCGSFIILSFVLSAILGGVDWFGNQRRPDQTVQFLPLGLLVIFLLPFATSRSERSKKTINTASAVLAGMFVLVNLLCGFTIIRDHLSYRGDVLTEADVPLIQKMQVVDFIASDWSNHSSSEIVRVDYELGGGKWDWVPEFGEKLAKWYPAAMTMGRSFDYELLRRYGLKNAQEGTQLRAFGAGRYLITYAFEDPPKIESGQITDHIFGRLRVSVVDK